MLCKENLKLKKNKIKQVIGKSEGWVIRETRKASRL